jgi:hypothetical protein
MVISRSWYIAEEIRDYDGVKNACASRKPRCDLRAFQPRRIKGAAEGGNVGSYGSGYDHKATGAALEHWVRCLQCHSDRLCAAQLEALPLGQVLYT